jgi:hypothetical protein
MWAANFHTHTKQQATLLFSLSYENQSTDRKFEICGPPTRTHTCARTQYILLWYKNPNLYLGRNVGSDTKVVIINFKMEEKVILNKSFFCIKCVHFVRKEKQKSPINTVVIWGHILSSVCARWIEATRKESFVMYCRFYPTPSFD